MREDVRELLERALPAIARGMEERNEAVPAGRLGETAQLRPATVAALETSAVELSLAVKLRPEHPFQCLEWQSRAGVDVGVRGLPGLAPVFVELKWGDGARVLGQCSWDLAKMGLAVAKRACSSAFLLAGAPSRRWEQPGLEGPELFRDGVHDLAHVRGPLYLDMYWAAYAREPLPQPTQLPAAFETFALPPQAMTLSGEAWELRCVEVVPAGDLCAVEPLPLQ